LLEKWSKEEVEKYFIDKNNLSSFEGSRENLWKNIFSLYEGQKYSDLKENLEIAHKEEKDFIKILKNEKDQDIEMEKENASDNFSNEIDNLEVRLQDAKELLDKLDTEKEKILEILNSKKEEKIRLENEEKEKSYKLDNQVLTLRLELEKLHSQKDSLRIKSEIIKNKEIEFDNLLQEMSVLLGSAALQYKNWNENEATEAEKSILSINQHDLLRKIERSKIKIEESGIINASEIIDEYQSLSERDTFLANEIEDLQNSRVNLENLIKDLKESLLSDFNIGLQKINLNFNNYFNEIFPGGKASLSLEKITKPEIVEGEEH
jgi:chromosome segregation protein